MSLLSWPKSHNTACDFQVENFNGFIPENLKSAASCSTILKLDNLLVFPVKYFIKGVGFFLFFIMLVCQLQENVLDQRSYYKWTNQMLFLLVLLAVEFCGLGHDR